MSGIPEATSIRLTGEERTELLNEQRLARNRQPERLEHQDECDRGDAVLLKERCQVAECMLYCRHPGIYSRRNEDIVKAPPQRPGLARTPTLSIGSARVVVAQKLVADKRTRIGTITRPPVTTSSGVTLTRGPLTPSSPV